MSATLFTSNIEDSVNCPCGSATIHKKCCKTDSSILGFIGSMPVWADTPVTESFAPEDKCNYESCLCKVSTNSEIMQSIDKLKQIQAKYPHNPQIMAQLATCYSKCDHPSLASRLYKKLFSLYPKFLMGKIYRGYDYYRGGKTSKISALFENASSIVSLRKSYKGIHLSEAVYLLILWGLCAISNEQLEKASSYLKQAKAISNQVPISNEGAINKLEHLISAYEAIDQLRFSTDCSKVNLVSSS